MKKITRKVAEVVVVEKVAQNQQFEKGDLMQRSVDAESAFGIYRLLRERDEAIDIKSHTMALSLGLTRVRSPPKSGMCP